VALKLLAPSLLDSPARDKHVASFLHEASLAMRVDSLHTVRVMGCTSSPELGPYIVMEMLDGLDLFEHLARSGTLEIAETATIVAQLCRALEALHAADVFHRDVKPENVMITMPGGRPCAKLIDFSIACDGSTSEEVEAGIFGTPAYLSPERLAGSSPGRAQADLWALGVLAYQCLVGKVPFEDKSLASVCVAVNRGTFTPPSAFVALASPGLDAWFRRGFARAASDRFASAAAMREALIDACSPFPLESTSSAHEKASRSAGRTSGVRSRVAPHEAWRYGVAR
jgi:serine/threonine-protein kinase